MGSPIMTVRTCRRVVQVVTVMSMLVGCAIAYFGIVVASSMSSTAESSSSVTAVMLATCGIVYVAVSMVGFCGVLATKERLQFLMIYFYATLLVSVVFLVFTYMALVAPSSIVTWLKLHWSTLPLRHRPCCRTFDNARAYEPTGTPCTLTRPSRRFVSTRYSMLGVLGAAGIASLVMTLVCIVKIASVPVVMRHMLSVVNAMFIVAATVAIVYGLHAKGYDALDGGWDWLAWLLVGVGIAMFVLALFGFAGSRIKSRSLLLVYAAGLAWTLIVLCVGATSAFYYATSHVNSWTEAVGAGDVACSGHLYGCSNCTTMLPCPGVYEASPGRWATDCNAVVRQDDSFQTPCDVAKTLVANPASSTAFDVVPCGKCPEWNVADVQAFVGASLHLVGILAIMMSCCVAVALAGALVLRRSLARYQTESI
ncbi:hypothetical protein, variant 1 [Aphanomyces invadans]|uniref:Tetraspanin n=1 Tax=Aphanomyces invadans TaxID=157072 RepID=A0A024TW29_9STRA|nr:hypothetical protein, variant 1 [Aphanomyces invadans]ETV97557.1 hypothetical protein, variant 1 [Aphanomyces invadans]|eukprot:XP_008873768.1 hypothetical protein, variant 1 [Aphanomyces invadans]